MADKLHPLHDAIKVKGQAIELTTEFHTTFLTVESAVVSATLFHHPHMNTKTGITVDALDREVGGYHMLVINSHHDSVSINQLKTVYCNRANSQSSLFFLLSLSLLHIQTELLCLHQRPPHNCLQCTLTLAQIKHPPATCRPWSLQCPLLGGPCGTHLTKHLTLVCSYWYVCQSSLYSCSGDKSLTKEIV